MNSHRKKPLPAGRSGGASHIEPQKRVRPRPVEPPESPRREQRPGEDRHAEERDQHPDSEREAGDDHREPDDPEDEVEEQLAGLAKCARRDPHASHCRPGGSRGDSLLPGLLRCG